MRNVATLIVVAASVGVTTWALTTRAVEPQVGRPEVIGFTIYEPEFRAVPAQGQPERNFLGYEAVAWESLREERHSVSLYVHPQPVEISVGVGAASAYIIAIGVIMVLLVGGFALVVGILALREWGARWRHTQEAKE